MTELRRVAVFCASSPGTDPAYLEAARTTGMHLAGAGIGVVYGGGRNGLMGAVADAALDAGGEVVGVIPEALRDLEVAHTGLTALEVVRTMHERKARMADLADAFVVLPGGLGTLDELAEALTWTQLGIQSKPSGLLEVGGFWDPLRAWLAGAREAGFVRRDLLLAAPTIDGLLAALAAWEGAPAWRPAHLVDPDPS
jgi:uncharacterized protein (TIGR00730 family)